MGYTTIRPESPLLNQVSSSPRSSSRSSDIDYSDVFGGPPRRSSLQDMQRRFYDDDENSETPRRGTNDEDDNGNGDGKVLTGRRSWPDNPGGKPVFGAEISSRGRHHREDFYDDIFRGNQSLSSSPRMGGKDPFSSAPTSQILSPIRPLTPVVEPLGSPSQFSLPAKLASTHPSSTSMVKNHDVFSSYRQSPVSCSKSCNNNEEVSRKEANLDAERPGPFSGKESKGANVSNDNHHFHFSIYKWASKGVPFVMSLRRGSARLKEKTDKLDRSLSSKGRVETGTLFGEIQPESGTTDDCFSNNVTIVSASQDTKDSESITCQGVSIASNSRPIDDLQNGGDNSNHNLLSSLQHGVEERKGNGSVISEAGGKQNPRKTEVKPSLDADTASSGKEVVKPKLKELIRIPQENVESNGNRGKVKAKHGNNRSKEKVKDNKVSHIWAKGKVKGFVKIYDQECSLKPNFDGNGRSQSITWSNIDASKPKNETAVSWAKEQGKAQASDMRMELDSSSMADGAHSSSGSIQFDVTCNSEIHHSSVLDYLDSTSGLVADHAKALNTRNDVIDEIILIRELPEIAESLQEGTEDHETIQASESKIIQWSKGKEGNIRALLSTLQYVLWPNSGWKPVPLVDIIEASSVKRAYQRALLCLHPDKLQQKGVASLEKYIAARVFDILQEAWDHFNSLGSL